MAVSILFFDCWYTLFTSDFVDDLRRIAGILGVPLTREFVKAYEQACMTQAELDVRPGVRRLMAALGCPADPQVAGLIVEIVEAGFDRQRPYDGTLAALGRLRSHYQLGLITNSSQAALARLAHTYELAARFDVLMPSYETGAIKPDPRIFQAALDRAGVPAAQAVMVGDSPEDDYRGARHAGFGGAVLLDRRGRHPGHPHRITELAQLDKALKSLKI
ncbi:MAG TPA: HAD family hydrolase [Candidatus Saccharimonadia bacterium]